MDDIRSELESVLDPFSLYVRILNVIKSQLPVRQFFNKKEVLV